MRRYTSSMSTMFLSWQLERHRSLDGDEPERVQSGSSSGDERVGRGHQSRADSTPRRRRVLPDVDVATADNQTVTTTAKLGKSQKHYALLNTECDFRHQFSFNIH